MRDVRRLVENTALTYGEIAARTGVARASICRWTRDGGWKRPLFAPRATDTVPRERASARLRARTLAARLHALSERYVRELEEAPGADLAKLGEALELLKMAKLAARPKRRRPRRAPAEMNHPSPLEGEGEETTRTHLNIPSPLEGEGDATPRAEGERSVASGGGYAASTNSSGELPLPVGKRKAAELAADMEWLLSEAARESARATVLEDLRAAGVNLERAPQAAVEDFIASRTPPRLLPPDDPALRARGHRSRLNREHAWLLGRDGD